MPAITDVEGLRVLSSDHKELGAVEHVLFHPSEPRAIGLLVVPKPALYVFARKARCLVLTPEMIEGCKEKKAVRWPAKRLPQTDQSTKKLGFGWDQTVIWRNMEVGIEDGGRVGFIADVGISRKSFKVLRIKLSGGSLSDVAVGRTDIPGEFVTGFDGARVTVKRSFLEIPPEGGLAAASAKGVVHARHYTEKAADKTLAAGIAGLAAMEKSFRSGWGSKATRAVRRGVKRAQDAAAKFEAPPEEER